MNLTKIKEAMKEVDECLKEGRSRGIDSPVGCAMMAQAVEHMRAALRELLPAEMREGEPKRPQAGDTPALLVVPGGGLRRLDNNGSYYVESCITVRVADWWAEDLTPVWRVSRHEPRSALLAVVEGRCVRFTLGPGNYEIKLGVKGEYGHDWIRVQSGGVRAEVVG